VDGLGQLQSLPHEPIALHLLTSMSSQELPPLPPPYAKALELIDEAHAQDPKKIDGPDGPLSLPYELHYARKMTRWLQRRCPQADPVLQLACRAQHFRRYVDIKPPSSCCVRMLAI
jgi:hypothetical protein